MKSRLFLFAVFCLAALTGSAQQFLSGGNYSPLAFSGQGVTNGSSTGPNFASNVAWFAVAPVPNAVARVQNLAIAGDLADTVGGRVTYYYSTNSSFITNNGISGTNILFCDTTGFGSNDVILLQSVINNSFQRLFVTNSGTNGTLMVWPGAAWAPSAGLTAFGSSPNGSGANLNADRIWKMTPAGTFPGSINFTNFPSITIPANPLFYGRLGTPVLVDMNYSNAGVIRTISGDYPSAYPYSR